MASASGSAERTSKLLLSRQSGVTKVNVAYRPLIVRRDWPTQLRYTWVFGLSILAIGVIGLAAWSDILASHFDLTYDYTFYGQAWYLISHGNLNPTSSLSAMPVWKNAAELVLWPLSLFWYIWPHPQTLLWVQDVATGACEAVLFRWLCELTAMANAEGRIRIPIAIIPAAGLVLLVSCPWILYIESFDFHPESLVLLPAILAARAFWHRGRFAWLWVIVALTGGALGATYIAGLGITNLIVKRSWRLGLVLLVIGVGALFVISRVGADASGAAALSYLANGGHVTHLDSETIIASIATHPGRAFTAVQHNWIDLYSDTAPGGFLGLLTPIGFGIPVLALLENALAGVVFIAPTTQNNLPEFLMIPFGTAVACLALLSSARKSWRRVGATMLVLTLANVIGWSIVWTPRLAGHWQRVSPGAVKVLASIKSQVAPQDEVVVSQGVAGTFSYRRFIYPLTGPGRIPVKAPVLWFIFAPVQGIEYESPSDAFADVGYLSNTLHARLVAHKNGIYALRWKPPAGVSTVNLPKANSIPVWTTSGVAGTPVTSGSPLSWRVTSNRARGYVVSNDYWREQPGHLTAVATISATKMVNVEIWDDTANKLLTRGRVSTKGAKRTIRLNTVITGFAPRVYAGVWPFRIRPVPQPLGDIIEIRIWSPGALKVNVYSLTLRHDA